MSGKKTKTKATSTKSAKGGAKSAPVSASDGAISTTDATTTPSKKEKIPATGKKPPRAPKPPKSPRVKHVSALDAAANVLAGASKPMSAGDLIDAMREQTLWTSPGGKTPDATLSAAIGREIKAKGNEARFKKVERGLFAAAK